MLLHLVQMAVEMAADDAVEGVVGEWKRESVALDELRPGQSFARDLEHPPASVERRDRARKMARQEARPAGDVERPPRRKRLERRGDARKLLVEPRSVAAGEQPAAEIPVVVLGRPPVVVRGCGGLAHPS